jgi:hypothetical protein
MAGAIKTSATSRSATTTLAADPDLQAAVGSAGSFLVRLSLRVLLPAGHGGIRWNLRLPTGSVGVIGHPWLWFPLDGYRQPPEGMGEQGIGINVGASAAAYFHLDPPAGTSGVLFSEIGIRLPAGGGTVALEWCQHRSVAGVATTMDIGSYFTAGAP